MEYVSTTSLANELDLPPSELFSKLKALGWIDRIDDKWRLTEIGKQKGGQMRSSPKFGDYIVWPENIAIDPDKSQNKDKFINATALGKHFGVSAQRLNLIISELGWIEKDISGWSVSNLGRKLGGRQFEHETSGASYVLWPASILTDKNLNDAFPPRL